MKAIKNIIKWIVSLFRKQSPKNKVYKALTAKKYLNSMKTDKTHTRGLKLNKYSGHRRYTKAPAIQ